MTERAEIMAVARGAKRTENTRCEINILQSRKVGEVGMREIIIEVPDSFGQDLKPEKVNSEIKGELVRCRNCKHGEPGACGYGVDCDGVWHDDDWYCADGEPKEGAHK